MAGRCPTGFRRSGVLARVALLAALIGLIAPNATSQDNAPQIIAYYNGESAANNFTLLKGEFDECLAQESSLRFQPYRYRDDAARALHKREVQLALLSSWFFRELRRQGVPLHPVLVGESEGNCRQTYIFWMRRGIDPDAINQPMAIASSRPAQETATFLSRMQLPENAKWDVRHLEVPKDIDAMLSVAFGMADAAIATRASAEAVFKANPAQTNRIVALGAAWVELQPILAVFAPDSAQVEAAIRQLERLGDSQEGRMRLRLLGLDRLRRLDDDLRKELAP